VTSLTIECPKCKERFDIPGGGDKEVGFYLIDRRMGRPRQEIDQRIKGILAFTADDYKLAISMAEEEDRKLLKEGTDATEQG